MTERINYVIEDGIYCGHCVNLPIVLQADSLEKLKDNARVTIALLIENLQKMLDEDKLEFVEEVIAPNDLESVPYTSSHSAYDTVKVCKYCSETEEDGHADWCPEVEGDESKN